MSEDGDSVVDALIRANAEDIERLTAERDALAARAERAEAALELLTWFGMDGERCWCPADWEWSDHHERCDKVRAALAAGAGEGRDGD